jgi:hypothetical protein
MESKVHPHTELYNVFIYIFWALQHLDIIPFFL